MTDDNGAANRESLKPPLVFPGGVLLSEINPDLYEKYYGTYAVEDEQL